jgi:hypothetical protein
MTAELSPRCCGLYFPGHEPHWIQVFHSNNDRGHPRIEGRLASVDDDGTVVVAVTGELHRLWNHEPARLAALVSRNGGDLTLQSRWNLLRTPSSDGGWFVFSVADPEAHPPCPIEAPAGDLRSGLSEAGGFAIPARDFRAWIDHRHGDQE